MDKLTIDHDIAMDRDYIPVCSKWEIQTKGNGSSFRFAERSENGKQHLVVDKHIHKPLTRMALDAFEENNQLRQQLAAALAAVEAKDNILVSIAERWNRDENEEAMKDACWYALNAADDALAIKPDASILKAHDDALIERVAKEFDYLPHTTMTRRDIAAAIRELKEKL